MAADYYLILGVAADASQEQIKSAYRQKVKELHPDHYSGGSGPFLALQEAYEVLSDPTRRRRYDDALTQIPVTKRSNPGIKPEPIHSRRPPAEPLTSTPRSTLRKDPFFGAPYSSLVEGLLGQLWGGTGSWRAPRTPTYSDEIHLQVSLTREQAMRGGRVRFTVPTQIRCPACRGQESVSVFVCPHCYGRGGFADDYPVVVAFPAGVTDGSVCKLTLDIPGSENVTLTLHFYVSPW